MSSGAKLKDITEGLKATQHATEADINEITNKQDEADRTTKSFLLTGIGLSGALNILGAMQFFKGTPYDGLMALGIGGGVTLIMYVFWTNLFRRVKDARTPLAWAFVALLFVVGLGINSPSTLLNQAALTSNSAAALENEQTASSYAPIRSEVSQKGTEIEGLLRFLASQQNIFQNRQSAEISGNGTGRGGTGHVSNALGEIAGRFAGTLPSVQAAQQKYEGLKASLDAKLTILSSESSSTDGTFQATRQEVNDLIAEIAAIDVSALALTARGQIDAPLNIPTGARAFQVQAITDFQAEVRRLGAELTDMAASYSDLRVPEVVKSSKLSVAWRNAFEFLPMTILAVAIDLIAPLLFLLKIPGWVSVHTMKSSVNLDIQTLRRNKALLPSIDLGVYAQTELEEFGRFIDATRNFKRSMPNKGLIGDETIEMGAEHYHEVAAPKPNWSPNDTAIAKSSSTAKADEADFEPIWEAADKGEDS